MDGLAKRVLIVEPEPDVQATLARILGPSGAQLDTVSDGAEASEHCRERPPHVALIAGVSRRLDQLAVTRAIKAASSTTVVALAAVRTAAEREHMRAGGVDVVVPTPFSPSFLLATVQNLLTDATDLS
jgi:DNA-binding response OmpR family regulator